MSGSPGVVDVTMAAARIQAHLSYRKLYCATIPLQHSRCVHQRAARVRYKQNRRYNGGGGGVGVNGGGGGGSGTAVVMAAPVAAAAAAAAAVRIWTEHYRHTLGVFVLRCAV